MLQKFSNANLQQTKLIMQINNKINHMMRK
jgi:hypothetical protein